jgi:hypothetical protein
MFSGETRPDGQHPADQGVHVSPQLLAVQILPGRRLLPGDQPAPRLNHAGGQLRAADVDGECRSVSFHGQPPKVRVTPSCT